MRRTVALLGASQALEFGTQLLLPVLLVRLLTPEDFGGYRVAWLLAQTSVAALTLNLAHNLVYQAARQPPDAQGGLLGNAIAYLTVAGLVAVALIVPVGVGYHLFGAEAGGRTTLFVACFVLFWVSSQPVETVALMSGRPMAQARLALVATAVRVVAIAGAAMLTRSLDGVLAAMAAVAAARVLLLLLYARHSLDVRPRVDATLACWQLRHAFGFGLGASLFALRLQADGWLAALLFDQRAVATIAIAASVWPVIGVVRSAFTNAVLPSVSQAVAQGRLADALALNRRVNVQVTALVAPIIGVLLVLAAEVLTIVFTSEFASAATPLRLYLIGYAAALIETTSLIQSLGYGRFVLVQGALLLVAGVGIGLAGAQLAGVGGIALGAVFSAHLGAIVNMRLLVRRHGIGWRQIQDWPMLLRLLSASACAAAFAHVSLSALPAGTGPWPRLAVGGGCFAVAWAAVILANGPLRTLYQRVLWRRPLPTAA